MVKARGVTAFSVDMKMTEKLAATSGLSIRDIIILTYLHSCKEEINLSVLKKGVRQLSGASITKIIDELVQNGFLNRRENPKSRREKLVRITSKGERIFAEAKKDILAAKVLNPNWLEILSSYSEFKQTLVNDPKYKGKYVAIKDMKVIDFDDDEFALAGRINKKYPRDIILIEKVGEEKPVVHLRSPRLCDEV